MRMRINNRKFYLHSEAHKIQDELEKMLKVNMRTTYCANAVSNRFQHLFLTQKHSHTKHSHSNFSLKFLTLITFIQSWCLKIKAKNLAGNCLGLFESFIELSYQLFNVAVGLLYLLACMFKYSSMMFETVASARKRCVCFLFLPMSCYHSQRLYIRMWNPCVSLQNIW